METISDTITIWLQQMGVQPESIGTVHRIVAVVGILLLAYVAHWLCRKVVLTTVKKLTAKTHNKWDDYLFNDRVLNDFCHLIPPIVITTLIPFAFQSEPMALAFVLKICWVYITIVVVRLICTFLTSLYTISTEHEKLRDRSMKGFYQMLKLIVICVGTIIIISTLIDKDPVKILTGLGASAAILTLVFKDTIMGLVAGVQLTANDMLRPGDWITMPKYGADGAVLEVTLTTVKIQNWDKTISTIPPYALVNDSFQNWRGMWESGGRRIKRSINIDMHTVRFCTVKEMEAFRQEEWMNDYEQNDTEAVNLHVFRYYMEHYLRTHPKVNQAQMIMIRQLQPTAEGLPIELYFFSDGTQWVPYEHLQAEVFDHLLATLHRFGLKVFQSPTGLDLQMLRG